MAEQGLGVKAKIQILLRARKDRMLGRAMITHILKGHGFIQSYIWKSSPSWTSVCIVAVNVFSKCDRILICYHYYIYGEWDCKFYC